MGTTRIKVIDLSSDQKEIKTSRKHAEKLSGVAKIKAAGPKGSLTRREEKKPKKEVSEGPKGSKISEVEEKEVASAPLEPSAPSVPSEPSTPTKPSGVAKTREPARRRHLGKKYLEAKAKVERDKIYPAGEAIDLLYKTSVTKFDPTVEIHLNVVDKNIRGRINLPHPITSNKKESRILFFGNKPKAVNDKRIIWGDEKTIDEIAEGKLKPNRDFDKVISTPKFMPALVKIAKILGPAGLMPNPKNGTVTLDIASVAKSSSGDGLEYRTDPNASVIHTKLGKLSYKPEQLQDNLKAAISTIGPTKIKKAILTTTMGPGIRLNIQTVISA